MWSPQGYRVVTLRQTSRQAPPAVQANQGTQHALTRPIFRTTDVVSFDILVYSTPEGQPEKKESK